MLEISNAVTIPAAELDFSGIRAQGCGGQNVNKVSSAIHLRFDVPSSSLPEFYKERLCQYRDRRINRDGVIVIKAQQYRSQEQNKMAALERLKELVLSATAIQKKRRPTKATKGSQRRRLQKKNQRSVTKTLRGRVDISRD